MGDLNVAPEYVAMTMKLQMERDTLAKEHDLKVFEQLLLIIFYYMSAYPSIS